MKVDCGGEWRRLGRRCDLWQSEGGQGGGHSLYCYSHGGYHQEVSDSKTLDIHTIILHETAE